MTAIKGIAASLVLMTFSFYVFAQEKSYDKPSAVKKIIEAYGGAGTILAFNKKLKEFDGVKSSNGKSTKIMREEEGDKYSVKYINDPAKFTAGFDGQHFWSSKYGFVDVKSKSEGLPELCLLRHSLFQLLQKLIENPEVAETANEDTIFQKDQTVNCIMMQCGRADPGMKIWIDANSFLILRIESRYESPFLEQPNYAIKYDFSDYHPWAGTMYPMHEVAWINGEEKDFQFTSWSIVDSPSVSQSLSSIPRDVSLPEFKAPFRIENGQVFIDGLINNHHVSILVDTGANFTAISKEISKNAGVTPINGSNETSSTLFGTFGAQPAIINELKFNAGSEIANFPVLIVDNFAYQCRLGTDIMKKYRVKFDFLSNQITFSKKEISFESEHACLLPFSLAEVPYVKGSVNGNSGQFIVDTGTSPTLLIVSDDTAISGHTVDSTITGTTRYPSATIRGKVESLKVGQLQFGNVDATKISNITTNSSNILGLKFLRRFSIAIFDFLNENLVLIPMEIVLWQSNYR